MKKTIIISFLLLLIPFLSVSADSVDTTQAAYGYFYYDTNHTKHTVNWSGYDVNYKFRGLADFPATSDDGIYIVDFGLRFHIDGNFKANKKYALTFNWVNYNQNYLASSDSFLRQYSFLSETIHCRESSFTSTSYDESHCYNNSEFVVSPGADEKMAVTVTWYFTPKVDFYTGIIYYFHDSNAVVSNYFTEGWEINNITWTDVTNDAQNIINNQNQNTQNIINNQNTNSQNIINNQNTNTQNIINNQNQNTQAIIDSNTSCQYYDGNSTIEDGYLNADGVIGNTASSYGVTSYIPVNRDTKINVVVPIIQGLRQCYYNINKVFLSCVTSANSDNTLTIPAGASYVRFSINRAQNKPQFQICKNGSQAVADAITDETPPDSTPISNSVGWLPPGPVDSILNLPLSLLTNISNNLGGTCVPVVVTLPFVNENITLPCLSSIYTEIDTAGNTTTLATFLTWFGTLVSGLILYKYLLNLYNWVEYVLTFRAINQMARWGGV